MPDQFERPQLVTVPTELDRTDAFYDCALLAGSVLVLWDAVLNGVPWQWLVPPVLVVAIWTLTGEPAADVPFIGAVAAGLRSKLGLRRAHEWLLAFGHFYRVVIWPQWRHNAASAARNLGQRPHLPSMRHVSQYRPW